MRAERLKGHLDMLVLATLRGSPAHGYVIIERLKERSDGAFDLAEGTIYPVLHRLETDALLTSSWKVAGGRRRRVYRLTRIGRAALSVREQDWNRFAAAVDTVLA